MRPPRSLVVLAIALLLAAIASLARAGADSRAAQLEPERRGERCPAGQVAVTLGSRVTCEPLQRALPRPRKGDERLTMLRQLLTSTWGNPPDLKNRRPPSIEQLLADFGPAAAARVRRMVTEIPATLDRPRGRTLSAVTASLAGGCGPAKGPPIKTDTKREDLGNGSTFDVTFTFGVGQATAGFGLEGKAKDGSDRTVRWDVIFDLCDENVDLSVPVCPTAEGKIDGSGKTSFTLKVSSIKDGKVEHSATVEIKHQVKTKGAVAVDAKLDRVVIDDTHQSTLRSTGSSIFWGPSTEKGTVRRTATVDMRTGRYDPGKANVVDVQVSYSGILSLFTQDALAKARVAAELEKSSDQTFARTVKHAIEEYRKRENAWQTPNTCAELEFAPASRTLRLRDGQAGSLKGGIKAERGGVAKDGRWRRGAQRNVSVSPAQASGGQPRFSYRVGDAEREVSASFRATSQAGVAAGDWVQGGDPLPARFTGTFSGSSKEPNPQPTQDLQLTWNGTIEFVRHPSLNPQGGVYYSVAKVDYTVTVVGKVGICTGRDRASASLRNENPALSGLTLDRNVTPGKGRAYSIRTQHQRPQPASMPVRCEGSSFMFPWGVIASIQSGPQSFYAKGTTLRGTYKLGPVTSSWNLRGSSR